MKNGKGMPLRYCPEIQYLFLMVISLSLVVSCTAVRRIPTESGPLTAIAAGDDGTLQARFSPVFVIENPEHPYNLIGTPTAERTAESTERVYVDPEKPAIYYETRHFQTSRSTYSNLIYRVHFEKVPFAIFPFYLGAGENVGLFVIVTLDSQEHPLLYTLVHTCGCYLAFVPTSYMPDQAFPGNWRKDRQTVHSENLPGMLKYPDGADERIRLLISLRHATHRVTDVWLSDSDSVLSYHLSTASLSPLESLEALSLNGREVTSFYETSGPRAGYVKSSTKIWERLFMSWWSFDWRIGEDKKLGKDRNHGRLFYTSLTPWGRNASDMRDFNTFLNFWGWDL